MHTYMSSTSFFYLYFLPYAWTDFLSLQLLLPTNSTKWTNYFTRIWTSEHQVNETMLYLHFLHLELICSRSVLVLHNIAALQSLHITCNIKYSFRAGIIVSSELRLSTSQISSSCNNITRVRTIFIHSSKYEWRWMLRYHCVLYDVNNFHTELPVIVVMRRELKACTNNICHSSFRVNTGFS